MMKEKNEEKLPDTSYRFLLGDDITGEIKVCFVDHVNCNFN